MTPPRRDLSNAIAIVGMAGRLPGAASLDAHWRNVLDMKTAFERLDPETLRRSGVPQSVFRHRNYVNAGAFLETDIAEFDAAFFGFSDRRAMFMDPQHRQFLECAWEALESAGYAARSGRERIGVFGGTAANGYLSLNILRNPAMAGRFDDQDVELGGNKDHAALNTAYALDLNGPALAVQSACSTSLLAVHMAAGSLRNGECDLALAGGVALFLPQRAGYLYKEGGFLSKSGSCRPFDARADGTVFASGAGFVMLKPYPAAARDGDAIHAVILGSAINNDGARKAGYVAPSVAGQSAVIEAALAAAGVEPSEVAYIETHGTGTQLGDPLEVRALLRGYAGLGAPCALGSVKAVIGHLDAASGAAGLITATLALRTSTIPGLAGFETANPAISLAGSPFYFPREPLPFPDNRDCVGVSSFGVGGTNVHIILCAPPHLPAKPDVVAVPVIPLSARTEPALAKMKANLRERLRQAPDIRFDDVAYTLQTGRTAFGVRDAVFARSLDEALTGLDADPRRAGAPGQSFPVVYVLSAPSPAEREGIGAAVPAVRERFEALVHNFEPMRNGRADGSGVERIAGIVFNAAFLAVMRDIGVAPDLVLLDGADEIVLRYDTRNPAEAEAFLVALCLQKRGEDTGGGPAAVPVTLSNARPVPTTEHASPSGPIPVVAYLGRLPGGAEAALVLDLGGGVGAWGRDLPGAVITATEHGVGGAVGRFLGEAFTRGRKIDFAALYGSGRGNRIPLPTYPFQRARHWIAATPAPDFGAAEAAAGPEGTRSATLRVLRDVAPVEIAEAHLGHTFMELGFDSLSLSQLVSVMARELKVTLSASALAEEDWTLESLLNHVERRAANEALAGAPAPEPRYTADLPRPDHGAAGRPMSLGPFVTAPVRGPTRLTRRQAAFLRDLTDLTCRRTPRSKAMAQAARSEFCDPRSIAGFDPRWKEMAYPIVAATSRGSRFVDVDGNAYVDMVMGFGAAYLGHSPDFVTEAIQAQLEKGYEIGPQTPYAADVARLVCELTGSERVAFCNTGSEAVAAALRVARTATRKNRIVRFENSYHGGFDAVLSRMAPGRAPGRGAPIAPGIPQSALEDTCILDFGADAALDFIARHADEIAAVLVEPVQSRRPQNVPIRFLHALREICYRKNMLLIFDEVITGFRCHLGGAQALFDVRADIALYGKVVGGGLPIGVIAGRGCYMRHLDGGDWRYGDNSAPDAELTFFAGTFVRHPLAMAAARASLDFLKARGPALQFDTTHRVLRLRDSLNEVFHRKGVPIKACSFASFIAHEFGPGLSDINLLFPLLRSKGVYTGEERLGHFSIAHSEDDMKAITLAYEESISELIDHEFIQACAS